MHTQPVFKKIFICSMFAAAAMTSCNNGNIDESKSDMVKSDSTAADSTRYLSRPLITSLYSADPSAHVFNGKIYIYNSHDIDAGIPEKDDGSHFAMKDYHVLSIDRINGKVTDNGIALDIKDIPWVGR